MYLPCAMAAKVCIFSLKTHEHRANLLQLFCPVLKLRGATLAELEEGRAEKFRTRKQVGANGIV